MKGLKKIAAVMSTLFFLYGCAEVLLVGMGAGAGIAAYKYVDGSLTVEYPMTFNRAWNAVNRALEKFQITISESINEKNRGIIKAVRKDGKKVVVRLKDKGYGVTSISVRVGTLGDRLDAQKIHDEIVSVAGI